MQVNFTQSTNCSRLADPYESFARDRKLMNSDVFNDGAVKFWRDRQLVLLDNLVRKHSEAYRCMTEQLALSERRRMQMQRELETEKQQHLQAVAALKQELAAAKPENANVNKDQVSLANDLGMQRSLAEKHKEIAISLIKERRHMTAALATVKRANKLLSEALAKAHSELRTLESVKLVQAEAKMKHQLAEEFENERQQLKGRMRQEEAQTDALRQHLRRLQQSLPSLRADIPDGSNKHGSSTLQNVSVVLDMGDVESHSLPGTPDAAVVAARLSPSMSGCSGQAALPSAVQSSLVTPLAALPQFLADEALNVLDAHVKGVRPTVAFSSLHSSPVLKKPLTSTLLHASSSPQNFPLVHPKKLGFSLQNIPLIHQKKFEDFSPQNLLGSTRTIGDVESIRALLSQYGPPECRMGNGDFASTSVASHCAPVVASEQVFLCSRSGHTIPKQDTPVYSLVSTPSPSSCLVSMGAPFCGTGSPLSLLNTAVLPMQPPFAVARSQSISLQVAAAPLMDVMNACTQSGHVMSDGVPLFSTSDCTSSSSLPTTSATVSHAFASPLLASERLANFQSTPQPWHAVTVCWPPSGSTPLAGTVSNGAAAASLGGMEHLVARGNPTAPPQSYSSVTQSMPV